LVDSVECSMMMHGLASPKSFVHIYCRSFLSKEINMTFFKIPICKDRDAEDRDSKFE